MSVIDDAFDKRIESLGSGMDVLLIGASMIERELVAERIYDLSGSEKQFINLSRNLVDVVESSLWRRPEQYPNAVKNEDPGTTFTEGEKGLPPSLQGKLEYFLGTRDRGIREDGSRIIVGVDEDVGEDRLNFYRNYGFSLIKLPPLNERKSYIPELTIRLLSGTGISAEPDFAEGLSGDGWPADIKELESIIESVLDNRAGDTLKKSDIPLFSFDEKSNLPISYKIIINNFPFDESSFPGLKPIKAYVQVYLINLIYATTKSKEDTKKISGISRPSINLAIRNYKRLVKTFPPEYRKAIDSLPYDESSRIKAVKKYVEMYYHGKAEVVCNGNKSKMSRMLKCSRPDVYKMIKQYKS